jgi:hypothetical protein
MVYAIVLFLSVHFLPDANNNNIYVRPILYSLSLGIVAYLLARVKSARGNINMFLSIEWLLLFVFVGMAIFFLPTFGHYFNVAKNKTVIQQSMLSNLQKADSVWVEYDKHTNDRIKNCEMDMNSAFSMCLSEVNCNKFKDFGFIPPGPSKNVQIKTQIGNLMNKLKPGHYVQEKKSDSILIENTKDIVTNWKPLGLTRVDDILEQFAQKAVSFKELDQFKLKGETLTQPRFNYTPVYEDTKQYYAKISAPGILPILYAIGLYMFMLLAWFMAERNFKSPGLLFFIQKRQTLTREEITID